MRKFKIVKCPHCTRTFKSPRTWCSHVTTKHGDDIPEGFTPMRYLYGTITGKYKGTCMYCNGETEWNEATGKYGRICGSTKCREVYAKEHQLLSPDKQREMLQKRKISSVFDYDGVELYYTGSYEYKFLKFMHDVMQWPASDIMSPSPNTYYYNYVNPEDKYHEGSKFYIPDFYIPSLNLEIEIKDQTTTHPKFLKIDKVKEACKDKKMKQLSNKINYFKINNNKFGEFVNYLEKMKMSFSEKEMVNERIKIYKDIMTRATEGVEDRELIDKVARELNRHEEAVYWMNDTHLTLIHYCESLEELEEMKKEWDEMDDINKSISDTQSIELFGMDNLSHYYFIKDVLSENTAFLPHVFEAGGEATESYIGIEGYVKNFFAGAIEEFNNIPESTPVRDVYEMINKSASSAVIYKLHMKCYNNGECFFNKTKDVPIMYFNTCSLPIYYEHGEGLYTGRNLNSIFLGIINSTLECIEHEKKADQIEVAISFRNNNEELRWMNHDDNCRGVKLYKIMELEDLVRLVDTFSIPDNEIIDDLEGVVKLPIPTGKEFKEELTGIYELPLRHVRANEYTLINNIHYIYNRANGLYQQKIEPFLEMLSGLFKHVKKIKDIINPSSDVLSKIDIFTAELGGIYNSSADFQQLCEYVEKTKDARRVFEEVIYAKIEPHIVVGYQKLIDEIMKLRSEAIVEACILYVNEKRWKMYHEIVFTNHDIFNGIINNSQGKVIFATPYHALCEDLEHSFQRYILEGKLEVFLESDLRKLENVKCDSLYVFGITPDEHNEYYVPYKGNVSTKKIFIVTLYTENGINFSANIVDIIKDLQETVGIVDMYELNRLIGYESLMTENEFDEYAMEALFFDRAISVNTDQLHCKKHHNSVVMITDRESFCRKQAILEGFERVEFINMDDILIGARNEKWSYRISTMYKEYNTMCKKYYKHLYDNMYAAPKNYRPMTEDLYDHNEKVMNAIAEIVNNNTDRIFVLYGLCYIRFFISCAVNEPMIIDDINYIRFRMTKSNQSVVSKLFVDDSVRELDTRRLVKATKPLKYFNIKKAKGNLSDPVFYHVSTKAGLKALIPRVPGSLLFGENMVIPRACVSTNVPGCLAAIPRNRIEEGRVLYVYTVRMIKGCKYYKPSLDEVPDQDYTDEQWILNDALLEFQYGIVITNVNRDQRDRITSAYGIHITTPSVLAEVESKGLDAIKDINIEERREQIVQFIY